MTDTERLKPDDWVTKVSRYKAFLMPINDREFYYPSGFYGSWNIRNSRIYGHLKLPWRFRND